MGLFVLIVMISFCFSLMLISVNSVSLGIIVWAVALVSSLIMSLMVYSWFGYVIFLVYVGGLMVMFGYFAAIGPNIKGGLNQKMVWYFLWGSVVMPMLAGYCFLGGVVNLKSIYFLSKVQVGAMVSPVLYVFFSFLLFFVFVVVVSVSLKFEGPLRPFLMK